MNQQNDNFYLAEAFQQLKCLNEDAFDLSADKGVVDELQSFVADDIEAPFEEEIIDIEAENEDDLSDNYFDKVVLECASCKAKIFKDISEIFIDEESGLANVEEECPLCGNAFGFNIIGKIEPFEEVEDSEEEDEVGDDIGDGGEEKAEAEFSDEEIGEALKEALNKNCDEEKCEEECDKDLEEKCDESLNEEVEVSPDVDYYIQKIEKIKNDTNEERKQKRLGRLVHKLNKDWDELYTINDDEYDMIAKMINDAGFKEYGESLKEEVEVNINDDTAAEDAVKIEDSEQEPIKEELGDKAAEDAEKLVDSEENPVKESLKEGIENLSLDTEDQHLEMTSDENGRVEIVTEPKHVDEVNTETSEEEMIAPLSDEDKDAIMGNDGEIPEEEAPVEDEFAVDDFDEESFDELGESFLRRVYENVESFNTTKATEKDGKLVVEGLIKFNSGKEKATSFVFENFKNTKRGKVLVTGLNETFSKSNRAFLLKGTLSDKKFVSESLVYNYTVSQLNESNENESVRVYGRAVVKK